MYSWLFPLLSVSSFSGFVLKNSISLMRIGAHNKRHVTQVIKCLHHLEHLCTRWKISRLLQVACHLKEVFNRSVREFLIR